MKIGKYFTLSELTKTNTGLYNEPGDDIKEVLIQLVRNVLEPAREKLGMPITVNSGYRSIAVNRHVGGARNSQHCTGQAADLTCKDNKRLFEILKGMNFDQLISERGTLENPAWIHVSFSAHGNRNEVLRFNGKTYKKL